MKVRVSNYRGYGDFEGELLGWLPRIDGVMVGYVVNDEGIADLFEERLITDISSEVPEL